MQDVGKGKAQLSLTAGFAEVWSSLLLPRSHQMSFIRLHSAQLGLHSTLLSFGLFPQFSTIYSSKTIRGLSCFCQSPDVVCRAIYIVFYLDFPRHIYSSLQPTPCQVRDYAELFSRIFSAVCALGAAFSCRCRVITLAIIPESPVFSLVVIV